MSMIEKVQSGRTTTSKIFAKRAGTSTARFSDCKVVKLAAWIQQRSRCRDSDACREPELRN